MDEGAGANKLLDSIHNSPSATSGDFDRDSATGEHLQEIEETEAKKMFDTIFNPPSEKSGECDWGSSKDEQYSKRYPLLSMITSGFGACFEAVLAVGKQTKIVETGQYGRRQKLGQGQTEKVGEPCESCSAVENQIPVVEAIGPAAMSSW